MSSGKLINSYKRRTDRVFFQIINNDLKNQDIRYVLYDAIFIRLKNQNLQTFKADQRPHLEDG